MSSLASFTQGDIDAYEPITTTPANGTVANLGSGVIRYTPTYGFSGTDTFNLSLNCSTDSVSVNVGTAAVSNITLEVIEQAVPYSDANIQLKINGVIPTGGRITGTSTSTVTANYGDVITFEAFSELPATGSNPTKDLRVVINGVEVYPLTTNSNNPGDPGLVAGPYTIDTPASTIYAVARSHADAPPTPIACGMSTTYSGGEGFPNNVYYTLGSGLGSVTLNYNAYTIPDRFVGYSGGAMVFDTGYRGDTSQQTALNSALAARGLPPSTITGPGTGSISFTKISTDPYCLIEVYSPLSGTAWDLTMTCPV